MKTKKYNFGCLMFLNKYTLDKLEQYEIDILKLRLNLKTFKDFKIIVRNELKDNDIYFYVERVKSGEIIKYDVRDILK